MSKILTRAGARRPVFFFAIAALIAYSACYSSDYSRSTAANVALVSDMSDKLSDYARSDFNVDQRRVSSEEIGEFYYTFNKASAFASSTPAQDQRASHRDFLELLAAYDMFVRHADAYRLAGKRDATVLDSLQSDHEMVKRLAKKVTADLRAEQG